MQKKESLIRHVHINCEEDLKGIGLLLLKIIFLIGIIENQNCCYHQNCKNAAISYLLSLEKTTNGSPSNRKYEKQVEKWSVLSWKYKNVSSQYSF